MTVLAELSDGQMVHLAERCGDSCEEVANVLDTIDAHTWVATSNGGAIRAGRIVGLWPGDKT